MTGNPAAITALKSALAAEYGTLKQYAAQERWLHVYGWKRLAKMFREDVLPEEHDHVAMLLKRMAVLDTTPDDAEVNFAWPATNVPAILEADLKAERDCQKRYQDGITACRSVGDEVTADVLTHCLGETEDHIKFFELQLRVIAGVGLQNYLANLA